MYLHFLNAFRICAFLEKSCERLLATLLLHYGVAIHPKCVVELRFERDGENVLSHRGLVAKPHECGRVPRAISSDKSCHDSSRNFIHRGV